MNKWWRYTLIFSIGALLILCYWLFNRPSQNANNFISLAGTYLEIYGLIITFLELLSVKKKTELIGIAVDVTKQKFQSILSLSDISRSRKTIEEIQSYLGNDKFQMAYLRLKDLRTILIESETINLFNLLENKQQVNNCVARVSSDINDLYSNIYQGGPINSFVVSQNLEELTLVFTILEQKIKLKNI